MITKDIQQYFQYMEPSNNPPTESRQSVMRQKRPVLEDLPFEDDDEDLKSPQLKFLINKKKGEDTVNEIKNPQDTPSNIRASEQLNVPPKQQLTGQNLLGSQIPKPQPKELIIAQGNPFNSNRMTVATPKSTNFFESSSSQQEAEPRMSISNNNDSSIFDMLEQKTQPVSSEKNSGEVPKPSKLELQGKQQNMVEKSSKESTPEFKWGQPVSQATHPSSAVDDDNIFKQLEQAEKMSHRSAVKTNMMQQPNSHISQIVTPSSRLVQDTKLKRDSADAKIIKNLADEEEKKAPFSQKDPFLDILLQDDDPSNYLHSLENPDEVKEQQQQHAEETPSQQKDKQKQEETPQGNDAPAGYVLRDDGYKSDDSFCQDFYLVMHDDFTTETDQKKKQQEPKVEPNGLKLDEQGYRNVVQIIDWNERRHQHVARNKLQQHSELSTALQKQDQNKEKGVQNSTNLRIFSGLQTLNSITKKIERERNYTNMRATALAISDDLLFIGNSEGQVWMFDAKSEEEYDTFSDKSKEFLGNSVTAIDVHTIRSEYIVIGYEKGQLVLFDATEPKKSIKSIKDHHNAQIVDLKFCDWRGGKAGSSDKMDDQAGDGTNVPHEDKKAWMFISIDVFGKIVINSVQKKFMMMSAQKHIIIDPTKNVGPQINTKFTSVACRFQSQIHGQGIYDDYSISALGGNDRVLIGEAKPINFMMFLTLNAPVPLPKNNMVALSWGHGMTPNQMDRPHSMLAVCWGPLIQIVVLIDHEDRDKPFVIDGYFILKNIKSNAQSISQEPMTQADFRKKLENNIAIQENQEEEKKGSEIVKERASRRIPPLEDSITKPQLMIESAQFISDSTLIIATSTADVRIVHTHSFIGGQYDPVTFTTPETRRAAFDIYASADADLESGLGKIANLLKSDFSKSYIHSLKFFQGRLAVLTQKNVQTCSHLTWQQSIYEYKKQVHDDLIQVFSRAISIYKGKVKGYRGLLDNSFLRENLLKAELKLLVKEIIQQVVEKTKQESERLAAETLNQAKPLMDKEGEESKEQIRATLLKLDQFDDEKRKKFETLIRIAIEFCVELRDSDFLFKDLFWLFQEEKIEKLFVQELEPFIMAGKLKDWELPNEVIQNHVIKYYKDPSRADALEKIIVNLNFKKCPQSIILEFLHFADMHYLTTAILFLHTSVLEKKDNSSCFTVLCSLLALYKKASKENKLAQLNFKTTTDKSPNTPSDNGNLQVADITLALKDTQYDSIDKQRIEKSLTYLGYKILWVLHLFIDGKKFPTGKIKSSMWRAYIQDIIEFISNQEYLKMLLNIDAESVFQMISIMFYPTTNSSPFELVKAGREEDEHKMAQGGELSPQDSPHWRFMKVLDAYCLRQDTPENVKFQYYYFVAKVIAKSPAFNGFDPNCFFFVTKEILQNHRKYIDFVKKIYDMYIRTRKIREAQLLGEPVDELSLQYQPNGKERARDNERVLKKIQTDIINLIKKCEPLSQIDTQTIVKLAQNTNLSQVKTALLEKQEQYIESLRMLLGINPLGSAKEQQAAQQQPHQQQQNSASNLFVISWISEKLKLLEEKATAPGASAFQKNTYDFFRREVTQHYKTIVAINVDASIKLVRESLGDNHKDIIDQLARDPLEQLAYLDRLLELQGADIHSTIIGFIQDSANGIEAKRWLEILKLHLKLTCQLKPNKVVELVETKILERNTCYPIEDCLQICQENKQFEAVFLLNKKLSKYYDCITLGVTILQDKIDYNKLQVELYYCKKHNILTSFALPKSKKTAAQIAQAAKEAEKERKEKAEKERKTQQQQSQIIPIPGLLAKGGRLIQSVFKTNDKKDEKEQMELKAPEKVVREIPPTIKLFDKIYGRMLKICQNHSKEVDQKYEETIWTIVIDVIITQLRPLSLKKSFAKDFFEDRFYAFIETYVKVHRDGFQKLFDHLLRKSTLAVGNSLLFSDMRDVILKMFGDQRLEKVILRNANSSIKNVNNDIFQQFSQQTRFGILFRSRMCGKCRLYIDTSFLDDHMGNDDLAIIQDDNSTERLKIFACGHIFHIECLKAKYLEKFQDNRAEVEKMFETATEKLRCINCNLKVLEVGDSESKSQVRKAGFQAAQQQQAIKNAGQVQEQQDPKINLEEDDVERQKKQISRDQAKKEKTLRNKQFAKIQQQMQVFDRQQGTEGVLTITNFRF